MMMMNDEGEMENKRGKNMFSIYLCLSICFIRTYKHIYIQYCMYSIHTDFKVEEQKKTKKPRGVGGIKILPKFFGKCMLEAFQMSFRAAGFDRRHRMISP